MYKSRHRERIGSPLRRRSAALITDKCLERDKGGFLWNSNGKEVFQGL